MHLNKRQFNGAVVGFLLDYVLLTSNARGEAVKATVSNSGFQFKVFCETGPLGTSINAVAWNPDGKLLAVSTRGGTSIQLWDVATAKKKWEYFKKNPDNSTSLAFTRSGQELIVSAANSDLADAGLSLISVKTGAVVQHIQQPSTFDQSTFATTWRLNADGSRLAAGFFTARPLPLVVYETDTWQIKSLVDSVSSRKDRHFAFSPNSGLLAVNAPQKLSGKPNPQGVRPVERPSSIELWDVEVNQLRARLPTANGALWEYVPRSDIMVLALGNNVSSGNPSGELRFFDVAKEEVIRTLHYEGLLRQVAVSADGVFVAATFWGGPLTLWDLSSNQRDLSPQLLDVGSADCAGLAFSPTGEWLAFSLENELCLKEL